LIASGSTTAHQADGVLQHTSVEVQPTAITIRISLLGGIQSYRALQTEVDQRGDPALSQAEIATWLRHSWIPAMAIEIDGQPMTLDDSTVTGSFAGEPDALFLANPMVVTVTVPIPLDGKKHLLLIRNDYSSFHSDYQLEVLIAPGTEAEQASDSGKNMAVRFQTDPSAPDGTATQATLTIVTTAGSPSVVDRIADLWQWIIAGLLLAGVLGWLVWARLSDQAATRSATAVRQTQASRKKPVAVRTIDAPDE
jgi:hypothetical protein